MAVLALDPERGPEPIILATNPVAVVAARRCARDLPIPMAFGAWNRQVTALQGKQCFFVEIARSISKRSLRAVAESAIGPESPLVRVFVTARAQLRRFQSCACVGGGMAVLTYQRRMSAVEESVGMGSRVTGGAVRFEGEERTAGVAVRAITRRTGMVMFQSKPGFTLMIEAVCVKPANVVVTASAQMMMCMMS